MLFSELSKYSMTYFKYSSGVHGHIFVNWLHPFKEHRLVLIASKGSLHFEDSKDAKPLKFFKKKSGNSPLDLTQKPEELIKYERELPLKNELKYFLNCVQGAPIKKADIESGIEEIKFQNGDVHFHDTNTGKKWRVYNVEPQNLVEMYQRWRATYRGM